MCLFTVTLFTLGSPSQIFLLDFSHQSFWPCLSTIVNLFKRDSFKGYLDSNLTLTTRQLEFITLRLFGYLEQFFALFSHVSSNNSMMSLSTRRVRTGGMIFSLFSICGLIPNYFEIFMKGGVHHKSLYLVLDVHVYLDSFSLFKFKNLGFLLICWSELFMLQQISNAHPAKWMYGSLRVYTMNDVLGYGCKRPLWTSYLLIA